MKRSDLTRRDFNRLTMAAFGGVVAGTTIGCGGGDDQQQTDANEQAGGDAGKGADAGGEGEGEEVAAADNLMMQEPHVCRGLNTCKGKGATGENACAGQGACASVEHHMCSGQNECKGQGGCGDNPGQNSCEGKGNCAVPLMDKIWDTARKDFEKAMEEAGKKVGEAPPKSES